MENIDLHKNHHHNNKMASIQTNGGGSVHNRFKQISSEEKAEIREKFDEVSEMAMKKRG